MRRHMMKVSGEKLPAWFREHIICWYSPKRQRATNESLAADPRLIDLSGKGMDLELIGFKFTKTSGVDTDKALVFSGGGEYGRTKSFSGLTSFTTIAERDTLLDNPNGCLLAKSPIGGSQFGFVSEYSYAVNAETRSDMIIGYSTTKITVTSGRKTSVFTNSQYNRLPLSGRYSDSDSRMTLGLVREGDNRYYKGKIYNLFFFDMELTQDQIDYVVNNLID